MATPNIVPNSNNEGRLGRSGLQWLEVRGQSIYQNGNQVADLASPAFTGNPTAPTQSSSDNSTKIATTAFVKNVLFNDGYPLFSAHADQRIPKYVTSSGKYEDSGYTSADFFNLANATGTLTSTGSLIGPTGVIGGSSDLQDDISNINTRLATVEGASHAAVSHTHVSADITDASATGTASVLVLRGSTGEVVGGSSASTGNGITGDATGTQGIGVFGSNIAGASGAGGSFVSTATSSPGAGVISEMSGSATRPNFWGFGTGTGNFLEFAATAVSAALFYITKAAEIVWGVGANTKKIAPGTATGNRVATLPDATGTIVLGDGSGVTGATAFRTAIGLGSSSDPEFTTVAVDAGTSSGLLFGSGGAKLALQSASSTTTYRLPSGGGSAENLVDGKGNGLTASNFRTALGVVAGSGGTMTGTLIINPSSGSTQLQLTGASGNTGSIICNPGGARTYTMPDATGTFVLGDGSGITSAASFRTALGVSQIGSDVSIGYAHAYIKQTSAAAVATPASASPSIVVAPSASFLMSSTSLFTIPNAASASLTYGGAGADSSGSANFVVSASVSVEDAGANHEIELSIGKGGTQQTGTVMKATYGLSGTPGADTSINIATQGIVSLAFNDTIQVMIQDKDGTPADLKVAMLHISIMPLNS